MSLNFLREQLSGTITTKDANNFATPPGWEEEDVEGGKLLAGGKKRKRWVQYDASGSISREFALREALEEALEGEAAAGADGDGEGSQSGGDGDGGGVWLGQLCAGQWELRPRAVAPAVQHLLAGLIADGAVASVAPELSGRAHVTYCVRNKYFKGEPFKRRGRAAAAADEEEEEELCDFEVERQKNIARNHELLRQLGLA